MNVTPATRAWALALAVLAVADAAVWLATPSPPPPLPSLPGFAVADVRELHLGEHVVRRLGDGWEAGGRAADPEVVELALAGLAGGIHPSARLGDADPERFGLDGAGERVEIVGAGGTLLAVTLGTDAPGGETFLRYDGAAEILRADVGGRERYDLDADALRDHRLLALAPSAIRAVTLERGEVALRGVRQGEEFVGDGIDGPAFAELARALAPIRGVAPRAAPEAPVARVVVDSDQGERVLEVIPVGPGRVLLAVDGVAWEVREPWAARLADPTSFADRRVWAIEPDRFGLVGDGLDVEVARAADGTWAVIRPARLAVDPARLDAAALLLSAPRVARWVDDPTPLGTGRRWWAADAAGTRVLELGPTDGDHVVARDPATGRTAWLDAALVGKLEGVFRR